MSDVYKEAAAIAGQLASNGVSLSTMAGSTLSALTDMFTVSIDQNAASLESYIDGCSKLPEGLDGKTVNTFDSVVREEANGVKAFLKQMATQIVPAHRKLCEALAGYEEELKWDNDITVRVWEPAGGVDPFEAIRYRRVPDFKPRHTAALGLDVDTGGIYELFKKGSFLSDELRDALLNKTNIFIDEVAQCVFSNNPNLSRLTTKGNPILTMIDACLIILQLCDVLQKDVQRTTFGHGYDDYVKIVTDYREWALYELHEQLERLRINRENNIFILGAETQENKVLYIDAHFRGTITQKFGSINPVLGGCYENGVFALRSVNLQDYIDNRDVYEQRYERIRAEQESQRNANFRYRQREALYDGFKMGLLGIYNSETSPESVIDDIFTLIYNDKPIEDVINDIVFYHLGHGDESIRIFLQRFEANQANYPTDGLDRLIVRSTIDTYLNRLMGMSVIRSNQ